MVQLEIEKLRSLVVVVREGGFARAAPQLFVSTSALSRRISDLEGEVGFLLLERTPHGVALTPAGEEFLGRAAKVLAEYEQLERFVADRTDTDARVRFGIGPAMAPWVRGRALATVRDARPDARVVAVPGQNVALIRQLAEGELELALLHQIPQSAGVGWAQVLTEPMVIAIAADHPLAQREGLRLRDLAGLPFVTSSQLQNGTPVFYGGLRALFEEAGIRRIIDIGAMDTYAMRDHVASGNGFTITTDVQDGHLGNLSDEAIALRRLDDFDYAMHTYLAWNRALVPDGSALRRTVDEIAEAFGAAPSLRVG